MLNFGIKMLQAALPDREIPWFSLEVRRASGTSVVLACTIKGEERIFKKASSEDLTNVRDILNLWPAALEQLPSVAHKVLSLIPVPKSLIIQGAPIREHSNSQIEHARLTMTAEVLGRTLRHHWDSKLNRLYMRDLLETVEFLKTVHAATEGKP